MSDEQEPRGIDEPPFVYSLRRIGEESDFVQEYDLGRDGDATVSLIRAAIESRQSLPAGLLDHPFERLLVDFVCGDPLDRDDHTLISRHYRPSLWILRGRSRSIVTAKMPLVGRTAGVFKQLLSRARHMALHDGGAMERLDGAILFALGFPMEHIEANSIPF